MAPHSNPNLTFFVVIEGGGFVQVGDERARVAAGEAVVWPPDVVHAAWTEQTPMRALVVEFAVEGPRSLLLEGPAVGLLVELPAELGDRSHAEPAHLEQGSAGGGLKPSGRPDDRESPEREPW